MTVTNGDVLKVVMEVVLNDGSIAQNVYYFLANFVASFDDGTITDELETWIEGLYGNLSSQLLASMTQSLCSVDEILFNAGEGLWEVVRHVGTFTPTIAFNNANEGLPNQSSAFATFNTQRPKSRGRKFLFPFGEDMQADTFLTGAALAAMANYADDALTGILVAPLSTLDPGIHRVGINEFLGFAIAVVTNVLGSQRRRRPGVGA